MSFGLILTGCGRAEDRSPEESGDQKKVSDEAASGNSAEYTLTTKVVDVINDPVFEDYGRLIFPVDRTIGNDLELQDVGDILVWYNNVNPDRTVEIANYLRDQAAAGNQIFYDIYTEEGKRKIRIKKIQDSFLSGRTGSKNSYCQCRRRVYVRSCHA